MTTTNTTKHKIKHKTFNTSLFKKNHKASLWSGLGSVILILLVALVILLIISPAFRNIFSGFTAIFEKYDRSEISNSTYFALSAESVAVTVPDKTLCEQKKRGTELINEWVCKIRVEQSSGQTYTIYPGVNIFVNIKNDGSKIRTVYAKPIVGFECTTLSDCESRDFLQSTKRCTIAPLQSIPCEVSKYYEFKKEGIYKIYPGYLCDVTTTDGCFEPGLTKAVESYNRNNHILITVEKI